MKVTVEYLKGSERTKEEWYFVSKIDSDPVHVHLIQDSQITALPAAQSLRMQVESDPETLIF